MSNLNANAQPFVSRAATSAANTSRLNANAQPFVAARRQANHHANRQNPENDENHEKCLFMTFSSGSPLTREEIFRYFTRERGLGQSVERVYVHHGKWRDPEFGKIIFTTPVLPGMIMMDREVVKIWVNKKPIWLKKYVPRSQRRAAE